jgi:hypothetical protein
MPPLKVCTPNNVKIYMHERNSMKHAPGASNRNLVKAPLSLNRLQTRKTDDIEQGQAHLRSLVYLKFSALRYSVMVCCAFSRASVIGPRKPEAHEPTSSVQRAETSLQVKRRSAFEE